MMLFLALAAAVADPAAAVDRWHEALRGGTREAVLALMADDVVVYEEGEAETSRDEYAAHHLEGDMTFTKTTKTRVLGRRVIALDGGAVVLSETLTEGTWSGRPISSRGLETMVLRRVGDGWTVAHIHWSSRRAATPPSAPVASAELVASKLREAGVKLEDRGRVTHPFFAVPARVYGAGEDELHLFEFASDAEAEAAAKTVGPTGATIGTTSMHWIAPPHVYRRGRVIAIHLGGAPAVRATLGAVLGPQIAGRP